MVSQAHGTPLIFLCPLWSYQTNIILFGQTSSHLYQASYVTAMDVDLNSQIICVCVCVYVYACACIRVRVCVRVRAGAGVGACAVADTGAGARTGERAGACAMQV